MSNGADVSGGGLAGLVAGIVSAVTGRRDRGPPPGSVEVRPGVFVHPEGLRALEGQRTDTGMIAAGMSSLPTPEQIIRRAHPSDVPSGVMTEEMRARITQRNSIERMLRGLGPKRRKPKTEAQLWRELLKRRLRAMGPLGRVLARGSIPAVIMGGIASLDPSILIDVTRPGREPLKIPGLPDLDPFTRPPQPEKLEPVDVSHIRRLEPLELPRRIAQETRSRPTPTVPTPRLEPVDVSHLERLEPLRMPEREIARAGPPAPSAAPSSPSRLRKLARHAQAVAGLTGFMPFPMRGTSPALTRFDVAQVQSAQLPSLSAAREADHACQCKTKRKQNRRQCRAKAPVKWAGGPRKGKLAGKRCISWEDL